MPGGWFNYTELLQDDYVAMFHANKEVNWVVPSNLLWTEAAQADKTDSKAT